VRLDMEKNIGIVIMTLVLIFLTACNGLAISYKSMEVNQIKEIQLLENPSTGYKWHLEISDQTVITKISDQLEEVNQEQGLLGAPEIHSWRFKAQKKGYSILRYKLLAPSDDEIIKEERIILLVVDMPVIELFEDEVYQINLTNDLLKFQMWELEIENYDVIQLINSNNSSSGNLSNMEVIKENNMGIISWDLHAANEGFSLLKFELKNVFTDKIGDIKNYIIIVK